MANIITNYNSSRFSLLHERSQDVIFPLSEENKVLIKDLQEIVQKDINVIGLHAIQVGAPQHVFVVAIHNKPKVFINAELIWKSRETKKSEEGCMSLPGLFLRLPRPKSIKVKYFDESGQEHIEEFHGLTARCIVHELNHGQGILISYNM